MMNRTEKVSIFASALTGAAAALTGSAALLCCAGPAVIALVGASGAMALAGLYTYQPYLLAAAFGLVGFAFWRAYRSRAACSLKIGPLGRSVLFLCLAIVVAAPAVAFLAG